MRHGCRGTMSKRRPIITVSVRNFTATKKITPRAFTRQGDADGIYDSEGVVHYEFLPQGRTVNKVIIWKLCSVFVMQSGKKDVMRGGRIDGCSNMTTRPHSHRSLSVTSWTNTRRLSFHSLRTLQISHQLTSFCFQSSNQRLKAAVLSRLRRSRQIR